VINSISKTLARLAIFAALFAVTALAARADHPMRYKSETSPGGLAFQHRFDPITPYAGVTFGWAITSDQKGREGLRAMLSSLLISGVYPEQPTEFYERLADLHATASLGLSDTQFVGEAKAPAKELAEALGLVMRALQTGKPNAKTFRRTRNSFINGEKQAEKDPQSQVSRTATVHLLGLAHPFSRGIDPKRYDTVKLTDVEAWRQTAFNEGPLRLVVSGRIQADEAGRMLDRAFAGWPKRKTVEPPKPAMIAVKPTSVTVATSGKQTIVQLLAPTAKIEPREVLTATVAQGILGAGPASRLFSAVRATLGSTYGASASLATIGPEQRVITLSANVDPAQTDASIAALRRAYADWYDNGITDVELRNQRERMVTSWASAYRDPAGANRQILPLLITNRSLDDINDFDKRLEALTPDIVNAFIKQRFPKPDDLMLVVGAPEGASHPAACTVKSWRDVATSCTVSR
jgi:zinc protease